MDATSSDLDTRSVAPVVRRGAAASTPSRGRRQRWAVVARAAALLAALALGAAGCGSATNDGGPTTAPSLTPTPSLTVAGTPSASGGGGSTDTSSWMTYQSQQYDLEMSHPEDWTVLPAIRKWKSDPDLQDFASRAHDAFIAPDGDVRVSVWFVPFKTEQDPESISFLTSWVEDYCEASDSGPCTGIGERAVELCLEKRDCHPGLLVPFDREVQAFFSGGIYEQEAMTVVSVWRPESHPSVARYGGAQRLLEAFLSTMQVWPASTPVHERG